MTAGVVNYVATFGKLPELDRQGHPKGSEANGSMTSDECYRRPHFDAGQFVERFDDEGARKGYCPCTTGCKGPATYNACSTIGWNDGPWCPVFSGDLSWLRVGRFFGKGLRIPKHLTTQVQDKGVLVTP